MIHFKVRISKHKINGGYVKCAEVHICSGSFEIISCYTCNNFAALYHYFGCFRTYLFSILHDMGQSSVTSIENCIIHFL
jgi:hypothetical protein